MIFLIEQLWLSPMENTPDAAYGYTPTCYLTDEAEAKQVVEAAGFEPKSKCWAFPCDMRKLRMKPIPLMTGHKAKKT